MPYRTFPAKDREIALAIGSEKLWAGFCRVIGRPEADEQVLFLDGDEPAEQLLEPRGRVLRGTSAAGGEVGQLDFGGVEIHGRLRRRTGL